eukprot:Selendium_serpulae@DN6014_c0_g1_i1.p1
MSMSMFNISRRKGPACITAIKDDIGPCIKNADWMSQLPDDKKLSRMTIPGTHNTVSYTCEGMGNHWVWCQCFDIPQQLERGVRFMDIRCRFTEGKMHVYHGKYALGLDLLKVIEHVEKFLADHPKETVIMSLQHEMQEKDKQNENWVADFIGYMEKNILSRPSMFRECKVPKLGEVRGKITVIVNYPCYPTHQLSWAEHFKVENTWAPDGIEKKWEEVTKNLSAASREEAESTDWYLTFCSFSDNEFPCNTAERMNNRLLPWMHERYGHFVKSGLGIVVVDYPGYEMIDAIIKVSDAAPWKCPIGWEKPTNLLLLPAIALNTPFGEVPGKTLVGGKQCWYGYDGKEVVTSDFRVVGGDVKPFAQALDGKLVKMGIAHCNIGYVPCKYDGDTCWYTYDGKEHKQKANFAPIKYPGA